MPLMQLFLLLIPVLLVSAGGKVKHTVAVCEQLLHSGANVNAADNRGATPILVCCASGRYALYIWFGTFLLSRTW